MMNRLIATVAVEKTFFNYDSDYDYYVPEQLKASVSIGTRVKVPFGKGNVLRYGIVVKIFEAINSGLKEIVSVSSKTPVLSEEMVCLALWLKERCFCTTYECLKQMLPRGMDKVGDKSTRMVRLAIENEDSLPKLTSKQKNVVNLLFDVGAASVNEVCEFCSVGEAVVKNLVKYGVCEIYDKEIYRNPYNVYDDASGGKEIIRLSDQQKKAYDTYADMLLNGGGTGLLYGVTGSGKTQVYLKLIDKAVAMGKDVIVMVPEIALTPQMLSIFHKRYGKTVAVFHSGLSLGERNDEYKRADRGEAHIVIGTRSAVFAPLHHLGLIIMDEEQEHTYKSERTPRYHAKQVANFRCKYNHALLLLTSATPSVESYTAALNGRYKLCELTERYGDARLPQVITVDMKAESKSNKSPISNTLKELIQQNLDHNKQTILLINRRGFNTFIACNSCGHVITCPNCSISLTYHSNNNRLMCHYCGYSKPLDHTCPECGENSVRYSGYGTQKIEDSLKFLFPSARVLRMDADTTTGKFSHQRLFDAFSNGDYDILIGTQMVAKGLDFPNVTLVGVVNADNSLYDENYTAQEKSFDLITQVVGRSGRRDAGGKAVIQTVNPLNQIIEYAGNQDYKSFYKTEIALRKVLTYPPFCDIYSAFFTGENENTVSMCAKAFFDALVELNSSEYKSEKLIVLGPSPAKISKISNNYRYRLAVKCKNSKTVRKMFNEILKRISKIKEYKDISVSLDLNPYDLI